MTVAKLRLEELLRVANTVEAKMADVGFGGDEVHRHLVADLAFLEFGIEDENVLVGGAEARCHRCGADNDRAGIVDEFLEINE